ncbi:MAG TPA: hypothetical protein VGK67_06685 [Myxococcales bacterium]|jgi:hypothetical protein
MNDNDMPPDDDADMPPDPDAPAPAPAEGEEKKLPPYVIEAAKSARSKCKTCRRAIDKGLLRIGILMEGGFYGPGFMWHHLTCAAKRHLDKVEEAYEQEAWKNAQQVPEKIPPLEELREVREKAEEKKAERKVFPYVEIDPSGRAKCKVCNQPIEKGVLRVVLAKEVTFGSQTRASPFAVHPKCTVGAFDNPEVVTEPDDLRQQLMVHSGMEAAKIDEVMAAIGPIPVTPEEPEGPEPE